MAPLYVAIAAVCVLGGILAVAILRYQEEPDTSIVATPATEEPPADTELAIPTDDGPDTLVPSIEPVPTTTEFSDLGVAPVPSGYRLATGPAIAQVAIPADWTITPGAVSSNVQANSPTGDRFIRFGGSAATAMPLLDTVATNEVQNPNIADGYQRLRLEPVSMHGLEAVDWEFLFVKDGVARHSYGRYWRLNGTDYVVYASTSVDSWPTMTEIVDVMVSTAGPIR